MAMDNGGFTFNRSEEEEKIIGYKPFKKPKGVSLKPEEKIWNTKLSKVQVVVENAICIVKVFKILGGVFLIKLPIPPKGQLPFRLF